MLQKRIEGRKNTPPFTEQNGKRISFRKLVAQSGQEVRRFIGFFRRDKRNDFVECRFVLILVYNLLIAHHSQDNLPAFLRHPRKASRRKPVGGLKHSRKRCRL